MKGADFLKFFFALVVVWIHTGTNNWGGLTYIAVPFFFVMSGYFLFGKIFAAADSVSKQNVVYTWEKGTLRLYLLWTIIYLPFAITGFYREGMPFLKSSVVWLLNVVFVGENYLSWPLWYLLGMIWAGLVIIVSLKLRMPFWLLVLFAAFLFILPHILPQLFESKHYLSLFKTTRNGFFQGLPYIVLGGAIRKLIGSVQGWKSGTWQQRTGMYLRFFSVHIYLTHMLWVGAILVTSNIPRGYCQWGRAVLIALLTGFVLLKFPSAQKFLYGRVYVANPEIEY